MESKKSQKATAKATDEAISGKKVWTFVGDIKEEFKKITWTSRDELMTYTKIVIGATFVFGMAIYFADMLIQNVLNALGSLVHLIGG